MKFFTTRVRIAVLVALFAAGIGGPYAVTSLRAQPTGTTEQRLAALEMQMAAARRQSEVAAVTGAIGALEATGLDEVILALADGEVEDDAVVTVRTARLVLAATTWPDGLGTIASALAARLAEVQIALESRNIAGAVAEAAERAHDLVHDLEDAEAAFLANRGATRVALVAGAPTSSSEGERRPGTPRAGGTAAAAIPVRARITGPETAIVGNSVSFDASDSFPDDLTYFWDFGDGSTASGGPEVAHIFQRTGTYNVRVTVSLSDRSSTASTTIVVTSMADPSEGFEPPLEPPSPPEAPPLPGTTDVPPPTGD